MDPSLYPAFIDQAMKRLPEIRSQLIIDTKASLPPEALAAISEHLQSILGSAQILELSEIAELTSLIDTEIHAAANRDTDAERFKTSLELIGKLETTLLKASLDEEYFSLDIEDFVDFSDEFELNIPDSTLADNSTPTQPAAESSETAELEGFEVDDELLEIFAEEAEGLLSNMERSLETLANEPNDKDSLWEIRRNAHTFKGSAGIVGLKQLSELAHRVEDLLDRLAESNSGSNQRIIELLHASTNCLKALTKGENSQELFHQISQLYYDFDGVLAHLNEPDAVALSDINEETIEAAVEIVSEETPVTSIPIPIPEAFISKNKLAEKVFAMLQDEGTQSKTNPSRSVVRVSLDRLDELVNIVRDMIISRSAFEQRIRDLERQIEDLHNTTRRLQSTSSKLEVDFEASMLSTDRSTILNAPFGRPNRPSDLPAGFDELEFDQYTEFHQTTRELAEASSDTFAINTALDVLKGNFEVLFSEQHRLVEDLQEKLMRIRMVEFDSLASRLQRAVRVTCEEEKKKAELTIVNQHLEVDTQILDSLIEPLMHLLKNSVVHGIESPDVRHLMGKPEMGSIKVVVSNEETHIVLTVSDDGRGIDPAAIREKAVSLGLLAPETAGALSDEEALELIFLPGLSTAEKLNLSAGRGVGMSIVKESIEAQKGSVSISSTPQKGTTFTVRMPLTLAITKALLVVARRQRYALPLKQIRHIAELTENNVKTSGDEFIFELGGAAFPIARLGSYLGDGTTSKDDLIGSNVLLIQAMDKTIALSVDGVAGTEEIVIKSLGRPLNEIKGIVGAAILGNGQLVPILDVTAILKKRKEIERMASALPPRSETEEIFVMIVDDSPSVRHLTSKVIVNAGWNVITAKDGLDALEQLKAASTLPKVILSDIEMPRMDGYEFAASIQRSENFSKIPVVMITSRAADKHREKAYESGVSQYLTKPYDDRELVNTIKVLGNIT